MKKMFFALVAVLCSTYAMAQDAYLQVTLTNDAVTKISLSDIKDFRFVTVAAPEPEPDPEPETPIEAVDLGLSVKWASCNLGASKPEEHGDYYGWGCTEPYAEGENITWALYFEKLGGTGTQYSDDCGTDKDPLRDYVYPNKKSIAGTQYDAAHVKLGGNWRMPTKDEIKELIDNTTTEWTTENGVYGRKVTSKVNGNSIFLPAAGYRHGSSLYSDGSRGDYWSATASSDNAYDAYGLYFNSDYFDWDNYRYRYKGQPVRPVSE